MIDDVQLLGDPHLGRTFTKGVTLARRGEREAMIRDDFIRQLRTRKPYHICMGDLFDKPQVPYEVLKFAYTEYLEAASRNRGTEYFIIQGNHDDSRDLDEVTAWDIFCDMVSGAPNIITVTRAETVPGLGLLLPWHPTETAEQMLKDGAKPILYGITRAFGHWDVDLRTAGHNVIPTEALAKLGITEAYTGHIHKPDAFERDGVSVFVVGSMQPYAQGEDGGQCDDVRYVTLDLERLAEVKDVLSGACVRLQLQPGEAVPDVIPDCRSWQVQRVQGRAEETEDAPAPSMEGFDTSLEFRTQMDQKEIIPEVREQIDTRWAETFGG